MVTWNLTTFSRANFFFSMEEPIKYINQLNTGNRLIVDGDASPHAKGFTFYCRYFKEKGIYYIWLTNDERRKLLISLKKPIDSY